MEMYSDMLNAYSEEDKDKAASWMYVYDSKGRPVTPEGRFPMITPRMIKQNLKKNQWLKMQHNARKWNRQDRRDAFKENLNVFNPFKKK